MLDDLVPHRWGVGSTTLHLDAGRLALGVLLFDRIVLPRASDAAETDRWNQLGWDTEAYARRVDQLDGLVHFASWDATLRADWRARMEHIKKIGQDARGLAYSMTSVVIAQSGWQDVMSHAGTGYGPRVRPVPIVWADGPGSTVSNGAARPGDGVPTAPYEEMSALKFRRILEQPAREHPEATLEAALALAKEKDFQDARRALYTAEALAAAGQLAPQDFSRLLDSAVATYNEVVRAYAGATWRRAIHHVVPVVAGQLSDSLVPFTGVLGEWSAKWAQARLLPLPPAPVPAQEEGAALALVERAMSTLWAGGAGRDAA